MGDVRPTETVTLCCGGTGKDERTRVSERTEAAMRLYNQTGSAVRARPAGNGQERWPTGVQTQGEVGEEDKKRERKRDSERKRNHTIH